MYPVIVDDFSKPQILAEEKDFLVVYKPPRMHSAPQGYLSATFSAETFSAESLLKWCVQDYPEIADLSGRKKGEGGLLHRLDYETHGVMLLARSNHGMEALMEQQRQGKIFKEYSALSLLVEENEITLPGFPKEKPELPPGNAVEIASAFRPYGPGRKAVRPVLIGGTKKKPQVQYLTEILESKPISAAGFGKCLSLRLRISKGFRHQIRSHLAWLGMPILNDTLYGGPAFGNGYLALRACSIFFADPLTAQGEERSYSIPALQARDLELVSKLNKFGSK
jgi:23S rRNA pseudouridine1911/1915/1917 synthase